jgi:eukaryotic-like serine/threonine-protein kinase
MGVVHLARDEHLERDVAVKRISIELDPDGRGEREALAAARLSHPGIVALYESGRDDEAVYLVSELVVGRTLAELLRDGALSDRDALRIGVTLCDALEHAHARGVIHRDVKPSNVICPDRLEEGGGAAKLTDFGIARMADGDVLTRTGDIIGTLAYMAPEQARGKKVSGAADVYALGIVLYEALTGVNPIRAGNPAATARRVGMRLPSLQRVRRDLPTALCRVVDAAVAPDPESRVSVGTLRRALAGAVDLVDDDPGPIAAPRERNLTATRRAIADATRTGRRRLGGVEDPFAVETPAQRRAQDRAMRRRRAEASHTGTVIVPERLGPSGRLLAGMAAAAVAGTALASLGPQPPVAISAGAFAAGIAVALLPRAGWLLTAFALVTWLSVEAPGVALLLVAAAGPVPIVLARRSGAWSFPATAPLLGVAGLAGAWPALAGQAARWQTRAALGALGGWWLALVEALSSDRLFTGTGGDVAGRAGWEDSVIDTARDAIVPLISGGALALAALWAVGAAILPLIVRGRSAAIDVVAAAGWAAGLAAATDTIARALALSPPRGLVAGAVVAGLFAVAARAVRGRA